MQRYVEEEGEEEEEEEEESLTYTMHKVIVSRTSAFFFFSCLCFSFSSLHTQQVNVIRYLCFFLFPFSLCDA